MLSPAEKELLQICNGEARSMRIPISMPYSAVIEE